MAERRELPRVPVEKDCLLSIEGRQVRLRIENLSDKGGLFRIIDEASSSVSAADLGLEATFVLSSTTPTRRYTGEIIRFYYAQGTCHVALRFWKKYQEIPGAEG